MRPGPSHHAEPPPLRQRLRRMLLAGVLILTPTALTAWFLYQLFDLMDGIFAPVLNHAIGMHVPGLGLLLTILVLLLLGWLSTSLVGRRLIHWIEALIQQIPVAKTIYAATKGVLEAVAKSQTEAFKRVVLVEYPSQGLFALAFVTGAADLAHVEGRLGDLVMVFLPTSPNPTSGFLILVPRRGVINLPITVEEGIRMIISGGILVPSWRPPVVPGDVPSAVPAAALPSPSPMSESRAAEPLASGEPRLARRPEPPATP